MNENTVHEFCNIFNNDPIMQATALEEAVSNMNEEMFRTLDLVAPTKEVKSQKRRPYLWYDVQLKQQRKILKNREHKHSHWYAYKCKRNRYINMLKFKKTHSLHQLTKQNSSDTKMLFKLISELVETRTRIPYQKPSLTKT